MGNFDLSNVVNQAHDFINNSNSSPREEYKYKILYPGVGKTRIKLLFNPASNIVSRLINRHKIGDEQVPCLRTWGKRCPICDVLSNIKNATDIDMYRMASKARGVSFAQLIESTSPIYDGGPSAGDTILFMYPYTVYKAIQDILSTATTQEELAKIISANDSYTIMVNHTPDNNYTAQLVAFNNYQSFSTEQEFDTFLMNLEPLNEQILPSVLTPEIDKKVQSIAMDLQARYLGANIPQSEPVLNTTSMSMAAGVSQFQPPQQPQPPQPMMQQPMYQQPMNIPPQQAYQPPIAQQSLPVNPGYANYQQKPDDDIPFNVGQPTQDTGSKPECFGHKGSVDPNMCMLCPDEFSCDEKSGK